MYGRFIKFPQSRMKGEFCYTVMYIFGMWRDLFYTEVIMVMIVW
jgi:hypothetical protein